VCISINFGNDNVLLITECISNLFVIRSESLAMATPWSVEFYENILCGILDNAIKVGVIEINNV